MTDYSNVHLFIGSPMFGGQCSGYYTQSMMLLQNACRERGVKMSFSFMYNESLITRARNGITHGFLKGDATHLLFIDADIRFNPEHLFPMIDADKPIICGIYPKKEIWWGGVRQAIERGTPDEQLKLHTGSFVVNLKDNSGEVTVRVDTPLEIFNGGTGFMLIKREVFEQLADKVPEYMNNVQDLNSILKPEMVREYFATSIDPDTGVLLSEDYHFCRLARVNGISVWAAPWVQLAHVGNFVFEGWFTPTE